MNQLRIAAESSLLIMDIVVQFEDGSIANVEDTKNGIFISRTEEVPVILLIYCYDSINECAQN